MKAWHHQALECQQGRQYIYSNTAIECLLALRFAYYLFLRQCQGFAQFLFDLLGIKLLIPNYTTLCRRSANLPVDIRSRLSKKGPITVVVDSTGMKIYGEGEWTMRKHGKTKRRTWKKLHLAVNPDTQEIVSQVLTDNSEADGDQVEKLVNRVEEQIEKLKGDGGYDWF